MFRDFPELKPSKGKFRIIGIDKFEIPGEEAVKKAREMTRNASKDATDPSVATVFYAYDENGNYLGGEIHDEG